MSITFPDGMRRGALAALLGIALTACGGSGSEPGGGDPGGGGGGGGGGGSGPFSTFMGGTQLLIGAQMADATAAAAPFDARYVYLAGAPAPEAACMRSCTAAASCGQWWGCWQDPARPPGEYAAWHIQRSAAASWQGASRPQVPVFTYYLWLGASGGTEGGREVSALNDAQVLRRYLDDWRFLLQRIGGQRVMLHIEPDLWGFVRASAADPHTVPAQVRAANPSECGDHEDSAAGLARCMVAMARQLAPNVTVGLHASPWNYRVPGDAATVGQFMKALGADSADFVATDPSDRDAGWYAAHGQDRGWDDAAAADYLAWSRTLAETVGRPTVMWQIPLGNEAQNNTIGHWKDTRVDYLFAHLPQVADAHIAALLFGAGQHEQTTPESDGGNLIARTTAAWQVGGQPLR